MELSEQEKQFISYYKNFYRNIHNNNTKIDNITKEKIWTQIYQKLPIDPSIHSLLFIDIDQTSIINELDTLVNSLN